MNSTPVFYIDEMIWFSNLSGDNDLASILQPHNSHLIGTTWLLYLAVNELVGPDYVVFRVFGVISVLFCSALLYTWAKRRIGVVWALLPAILLLFFGSAWTHVVGPIGVTFSIAAGARRPSRDAAAANRLAPLTAPSPFPPAAPT